MKTPAGKVLSRVSSLGELEELRARLAEAQETIRAIRTGEADAVVTSGKQGIQVFTLEGAGHAYRLLIESMNEGALTLSTDKMILYANECFAKMVKCPLGKVIGSSFRRFLSFEDRIKLRALVKRAGPAGFKVQVRLHACDNSQMPVQISIRHTARHGSNRATVGMVVTDLTEAQRNEELLRALTHRVIHAQEDERGRVALELHDGITQLCCAIQFRSQALVASLSIRDWRAKREAKKLRDLSGRTGKEVVRIAHNLRPSALDQLGLAAAMQEASKEFEDRTEISVKLACSKQIPRLPAETEMALYRIFQEALRNAEMHARAHKIKVGLRRQGCFVELVIDDDGVGFDPDHRPVKRKGTGGLGLLGMRERATFEGGTLKVTSVRRVGTEIEVRIPFLPRPRED